MVLKIFMFHDVLEKGDKRLNIPSLIDTESFENKIIFLKKKFNIITFENFLNNDYSVKENNCILTFDDGLLCHYTKVYPILKKYNIIGSFFISGIPLFEKKITNSHKIQFLIENFEDDLTILLKIIFKRIKLSLKELEEIWDMYSKSNIKNNTWSKEKIFITRILRDKNYSFICEKIFEEHILSNRNMTESEISDKFYLDKEKIKDMLDNGMEIGCHGYTHQTGDTIENITKVKNFLLEIGVKKLIYSYPNGNIEKKLIKENNFIVGLTTKKSIVSSESNLLELPRYNCTDIKENDKKIVLCGIQRQGLEICQFLIKNNIHIDTLVTIDENLALKNKASGWVDYKIFAEENNIKIYYCRSYSLKNEKDVSFFNSENFDILLLGGWQRLLPEEIIKSVKFGSIGQHGSSELLPRGRGRSPINWSIIMNRKRLVWNIFFITPGIDDGEILDSKIIDINDFDTCDTVYKKISIVVKQMYLSNIPKIFNNEILTSNQKGNPTFYQKRTPEDGMINWELSVLEIYNLIRAVTKPYPGAYTYNGLEKIMIWKAQPYDSNILYFGSKLGEIVEIFEDKTVVVNCCDGTLLVTEHSSGCLYKGDKFSNHLLKEILLK